MGSSPMRKPANPLSLLKRFFTWVVSVPIFLKIMGTGMIVAFIFGIVVLYQTQTSLSRTLYRILEQRTESMAVSLASYIERPLVTGSIFTVKEHLMRLKKITPDLRYIIVEDKNNQILVHTFEKSVPPDLVGLRAPQSSGNQIVNIYGSEKGRIFEAAVPLIGGSAGYLRLGITDQMVTTEMSSLNWLLLLTLGLCMAIGLGLALFLTYILTRPIQNLLLATNRISDGEFDFRTRVFSGDEIGMLAEAFNRMASGLQRFRQEVKEKEDIRQALIEKIVQAQEEERASIARDLHDQLGQSLSALLLEIQSATESDLKYADLLNNLETKTYRLIDEVRHLAWGMRPSILDDYGLNNALSRYIDEISKSSKMKIDYQYICPDELSRLPMRTEVTLYRIAQEATTNIMRHAKAKQTSVILMRNMNDTLLLIEDDGIGFDPESFDRDGLSHMGLIDMRERAALLGAEFKVESSPGNGTTIRVKITQEREELCL
jgi:signal transduction histidine kinase